MNETLQLVTLGLNIIVIPFMVFVAKSFMKHEQERVKMWLLLKQICKKLDIETGE
jgi:hypothetical protein